MSDRYDFSIVPLRRVIKDALEEMMAESLAEVIYRKVDNDVEDFLAEHEAEPTERKKGKWIPATPLPMEADSYKHKQYWKCSVCGGHDFFNPQYSEKVKFCRYCGAELEVDE